MKNIEELRKLDIAKLFEELEKENQLAFKHDFEVRNGVSKSSHLVSSHQKQYARIKTIIKEKTNHEK